MHFKISNIRVNVEPTASEISSSHTSIPSPPTLPKLGLDPGLLELAEAEMICAAESEKVSLGKFGIETIQKQLPCIVVRH